MAEKDIRVALFTDTYDEVNGVANTFHYLTAFCQETDRLLDVYTHSTEEDDVEELGTVTIRRYKPAIPIDIYFDMIFDLKIPRIRLMKDFRSQKYDLIHTATPGSMGLNALIVRKLSKLPMVGSYHTSLPEYVMARVDKIVKRFKLPTEHSAQRGANITWEYMKWYYNQTELVLVPSQHTKSELESRIDTEIGIFTRGIETERFHPGYRREHDGVDVLYVGRVSIEKNLDVLVNIFKDRTDSRLVVIGDGPYLKEMKTLLPTASFPGFLKGEELCRAYASADLFAFPSTTDTFGNVVLEAMSSGLPVIVTDKMGPKELVDHGKTGFITRDTDDFEDKLNTLIRDKVKRQDMGSAARAYAMTRSWGAVFERLFDDYLRIAASNARR
jgi:glycosyltransferase involved in cell wall biosynthesis